MWWCVNSVWQNVTTINEFAAGHNDDCGPCANENLWAGLAGRAPSSAEMDAIRTRDIQANIFVSGSGQGIADIYHDYLNFWHYAPSGLVLNGYNAGGYTLADLVAAVTAVGNSGGHGGVIVEIHNAYMLPFNEPGVNNHFIALLGYDSVTGKVLVANGDREPLPAGTGKPDWYPLSDVAAAMPIGILTVLQNKAAPMTVAQTLAAAGWTDTGNFDPNNFGAHLVGPSKKGYLTMGFRQDVLNNGIAVWDEPLEAGERGGVQLLLSDPRYGKGDREVCAGTVFIWVPNNISLPNFSVTAGVYRIPAGVELQWLMANPQAPAAPPPAPCPPVPDNSAAIAALKADVQAAQATLATMLNDIGKVQ